MVRRDDIESLLSTGSWRSSRSRSPNPYGYSQRRPYAYEPSQPNIGVSRAADFTTPRTLPKRPPPPCVEDEAESLAKEYHGSGVSVVSTAVDEEPKNRGEIDQQPILMPVHEYNPERRFVIVPSATTDDEAKTAEVRYNANTCRKYVIVGGDKPAEVAEPAKGHRPRRGSSNDKTDRPESKESKDAKESKEPKDELLSEKREIPKRRSHQDLPRLNTDVGDSGSSIRRSNSRRDREKPYVHQETHPSPPRERPSSSPSRDRTEVPSERHHDTIYLSPRDVRYPSGGRERAYSDARADTRSGRSPSRRDGDAEIEVADRRRPHGSKYSDGHHSHHKSYSTTHYRDGRSSERPKSLIQPLGYGDPDEIFAFMAPGDDFMTGKPARGASPPRHPRGAREMPNPSPTRRRPYRSGRDRTDYSSEDEYNQRRPKGSDRPYPPRTTLEPDYPSGPPESARRVNPALAGVAIPPAMAAAHAALFPDEPQASPRTSAFSLVDRSRKVDNWKTDERSLSSSPANNTSPTRKPLSESRNGLGRPPSRDPSVVSASAVSASTPSLPRSPPPLPERPGSRSVTALVRQDSGDSPPAAPHMNRVESWETGVDDDDTKQALSRLPDCPWKSLALARRRPVGPVQFYTLKRAENFKVCPDCFGALFANTEFQHQFIPLPIPGDQAVVCDFGASPWYRIAFLMTLKHNHSDLRLLQGIASVAARSQPCAGRHEAVRIWYSMMDPNTRRPIKSFNACHSCARMTEVVLPNLTGVFIPLDAAHEPMRGKCELWFDPDRKRFFDYFEEMMAVSDQALTRRTAPDVVELAERVREISSHDECPRNTPVEHGMWHVMKDVPSFTVCDECFHAVVWPVIQDDDNPSELARNFYKYMQPRELASCQLYSERMRQVFLRACRRDDYEYLRAKVRERMREMEEIRVRYRELVAREEMGEDDPRIREELAALARRMREVE